MIKNNYSSIILYLLSIFFLYPILSYTLMYRLSILINKLPHGQLWFIVQTYLSGPCLIVIGLVFLFRKQKNIVLNKALGAILSLIGFIWLVVIINEIIKEAA